MRVSDVEAAFPMLPYHPDVWPFVMFRFYASNEATNMGLFCHLFGDFGAAGMPGTFNPFTATGDGHLPLPPLVG